MGEGSSKFPLLSRKDPKYKKLTDVFKSYNIDFQKLLDEFLTEEEKTYAENRDIKIENEKLRKNNHQLQQTIRSLEQNTVSKPSDEKLVRHCLDLQTKLETQVKNLLKKEDILNQEINNHKREIQILSSEKESALSRLAEETEKGIANKHKLKVEISNLKIEIDRADAKFRENVRDYETLNSRYKKQQAISSSERCQFEDELKDLRLKLDGKSSKFVDSRWRQEEKPEQTSLKELEKNTTGQAQVFVHYGDFLKEKSEQLANDFLQLHEHYWKEAMSELGEIGTEKNNIEFLLTILQNAYSFSAHLETRFREEFEQVLLDVSTRIKEVVDTTLLVREILEKLTSSIKQLFIRDPKYQEYGTKGPAVQSYTTEAVSICWLMVTRSPRVIISTTIPKEFHSDFFNPYKKFGSKVDFVVWPIVKLANDEGQIICRGTAVFK